MRGLVDAHHWLHGRLPGGDPLLSETLLAALSPYVAQGLGIDAAQLALSMGRPVPMVAAQLDLMRRQGLLCQPLQDRPGGPLQPTAALQRLLEDYGHELQARFIDREPRRRQQWLSRCTDPALARQAQEVYEQCFNLGWLYLHLFGSRCFMISSLLAAVLALRGHQTRVAVGHLEVTTNGGCFKLGNRGVDRAGEIDAHAVCVVDERMVVDYGLGNLRRNYRSGFHWGLVADKAPVADGTLLARALLPEGETVSWYTGWRPAGADEELARCARLVPSLVADYQDAFAA